ncbi:hypothetical protein OIV83_001357 [Microbotryomycetes sp. JL201]|nr:hypothetical protein OIV83_001357 [Microbotryomycetes sp. JL201]
MSASGSSIVSGLGITFDFEGRDGSVPLYDDLSVVAVENDGVVAGSIAQQFANDRARTLKHSISVDDGMRGMSNYRRRQHSPTKSHRHHRRGKSNGAGAVAAAGSAIPREHHANHYKANGAGKNNMSSNHFLLPPIHAGYPFTHSAGLSPLTEPEHSSSSDSDGRDYSPASLSSMPSSTASHLGQYVPATLAPYPGAGAEYGTQYSAKWDHRGYEQLMFLNPAPFPPTEAYYDSFALTQPSAILEAPQFVPPPPLVNEDLYNGSMSLFDQDQIFLNQQHADMHNKHSRLPSFLRNQSATAKHERMSKAKSMHELGRMYQVQAGRYDDVDIHDQRSPVDDGSPAESVPSSAGGLQRRNVERQLQEQKRLFEEEKRKLRHSTNATDRRQVEATRLEAKQLARQRSRSMCATDKIPRVPSKDSIANEVAVYVPGLRRKSDGGARLREERQASEDGDDQRSSVCTRSSQMTSATPVSTSTSSSSMLVRHSTLMSANANPVRRSKELDRLLAPSEKTRLALASLPSIAASPDLSELPAPSSVVTTSSAQLSASSGARSSANRTAQSARKLTPATASPVMLEQASNNGKARVEIDLLLESTLIVEGGELRGKLNVRVKRKHGEVWVSRPKVRVVGFEELASEDGRHVFYHHATTLSGRDDLRYCSGEEDNEGFKLAQAGETFVPFAIRLPVGRGAKGSMKTKQCTVRYIAIASIKLKSPLGYERSIAHFYRQIDLFPYYNPAVILAPASRPLVVTESKSLFMGGTGKVKITAKLHRSTWVAGQRCYVDLNVDNGSSKKVGESVADFLGLADMTNQIKSLTLTLIRSTTILRPRPYLETQVAPAVQDETVPTQTTRKKVAESALEMGKKASKGVTAKGSWLGVEPGEAADYSHFLLVPPEELSIARGRHVEVTYAIRASAGSSLSADVSAEIPIRVVSFLSLDPPPGHIGDSSSADPEAHPLARTWSLEQLQREGGPAVARRPAPTLRGMASLDSLRLSELNLGRVSRAPGLSRVASMDTIRTEELSRTQSLKENAPADGFMVPSRRAPLPPLPRHEGVVGRAIEKQMAHRMSLECLSSVVASATARRRGQSSLEPSPELPEPRTAVQLDDLDEVPDDNVFYVPAYQAPLNDEIPCIPIMDDSESEDELELDAVMQSKFSDDEEDGEDGEGRQDIGSSDDEQDDHSSECDQRTLLSESFPRPPAPAVVVSDNTTESFPPMQAGVDISRRFSFATPASPVKANIEVVSKPSPTRQGPLAPPPRSAARPAPSSRSSSTAPSPTFSSPTKSSVAREQASSNARTELFKKPSATSLKRSPGVVRRQSNKSLAEAAAHVGADSESSLTRVSTASGTTLTKRATAKSSPTIAITAPTSPAKRSPRSPSLASTLASPRRVLKSTSPSLRAARSMGDLRGTSSSHRPALPPLPTQIQRKAVVLPSIQSKVAALEQRQAVLHKLSPTKKPTTTLPTTVQPVKRTNSILSDVSTVTSSEATGPAAAFRLSELQRGNSVMSFKAPLLRQHP